MINISYSRASCWQNCKQQHYFRYVEKLEPKKPILALNFGKDVHTLLQYRHDVENLELKKKQITELYNDSEHKDILGCEYLENLFNIFDDYQEIYKNEPKPMETELDFNFEIGKINGNSVVFNGKIDEIYKDKNNLILGEHKTFSTKPNALTLTMNTQAYLYACAAKKIKGSLPTDIIWDYIKSKPASSPTFLKSGRLSEAASQNITPQSCKRHCSKSSTMSEKDINIACERYTDNVDNFFFKKKLEIIPEAVDMVWKDFKDTCRDIVKFGEKVKTKNITYTCSFCTYKDICNTEFTGGDIEYIKENDFKERKKDV